MDTFITSVLIHMGVFYSVEVQLSNAAEVVDLDTIYYELMADAHDRVEITHPRTSRNPCRC